MSPFLAALIACAFMGFVFLLLGVLPSLRRHA
jgi:hypothetical protein